MEFESRAFYEREYQKDGYSNQREAESHAFFPILSSFIDRYDLKDKKCLEVGCGRGAFQDVVPDYTGVDLSATAGKHLHKPFSQASATRLPFKDNSFDAIWSYAMLEHVPEPEKALEEMIRIIKPEGVIILNPAWRVPPWRPKGYEVKKYSDLRLTEKGLKIIVRIFNYFWMRGVFWVPLRIFREITWAIKRNPIKLNYIEFKPNYEEFLLPDSDACISLDNHEVILWFLSRGLHLPDPLIYINRIMLRCKPVVVIKPTI